MKLFKPMRLAIFGLGFLAGSRSGKGAWNAFENTVSQLQNRTGGNSFGSGFRSMTSPDNGNVREGIRAEF